MIEVGTKCKICPNNGVRRTVINCSICMEEEYQESECTKCSRDKTLDGKRDCQHCKRVTEESRVEAIRLYDETP